MILRLRIGLPKPYEKTMCSSFYILVIFFLIFF